ncbi:hypothetical protein JVT61DRAFT_4787 [Boletus reticuloceps]|uniref:FAD-binding domain-containing protein n=1 Tax=Boletus reticuloceps TaxID=495285 RepID=A0A8I2YKA9_9AGAM|nr:hypothetical protein JVT61DRAFT_4787 [Boletus reticuloceps]
MTRWPRRDVRAFSQVSARLMNDRTQRPLLAFYSRQDLKWGVSIHNSEFYECRWCPSPRRPLSHTIVALAILVLMKSTFHVAICGGGMGGLMLALVIGKYGTHPVEIFEAGPTITTIGAGIGFFGTTMDIMKDLGLYDELTKMSLGPPKENIGPIFRKSDQRDGYHWFSRNLKRGHLTVHRKDMVEFLLRHVPASCKIHTSKRLDSYDVNSETGKITLQFSDGSTSVTDVLVGADGIHSATRKTMYQKLASSILDDDSRKRLLECIDPVWTGTLVYRSLVPTSKLRKEYPDVELPTGLTMVSHAT